MNKPLVVIFAAVLIDAIGIGLIFPILPRLLEDVTHVDNIAPYVGGIGALYALMQFIFSPVLGLLSDRFGRRPVLLISLAGAAVDYLIMAFAPQLWILVVGRAISGLTSANMAVATAYITDITPEEQRARRFGLFHAMFGVGFIIGPVLGGALSDVWVRAPFIVAAALNGCNLLLALFVLPESRPGKGQGRVDLGSLNPLKPMRWALGIKPLLPLMLVFLIFNITGQVYGTCWALWGFDAFQWNGLWVGLSLGAFGLCHALAQVFLPGPAVKMFGERNTMLLGMLCEGVSLLVIAFVTQGWVVFAIMPIFSLGGIGVPALQSLTTQQVGEDQQGQLQGVLASIVSIASIFGPLLFGSLYFVFSQQWPGAIWLTAIVVYVCAIPMIMKIRQSAPAAASA